MGGGPRFFVFFDTAEKVAIGEKIVLSGKSILSRKSRGGGKIFGEDRYSFHVTDWGNMIHVRFLFVLFFG